MFNDTMVYNIHCKGLCSEKCHLLAKHVYNPDYILVIQTISPKKYLIRNSFFPISLANVENC